jgi:hypothetical protein
MIRQRFREERSSLGIVLRPVAEVILEKDSFAVEIPMYVDSGADISMIPYRFGRALGLSKRKKIPSRKLRAFQGQESLIFSKKLPWC